MNKLRFKIVVVSVTFLKVAGHDRKQFDQPLFDNYWGSLRLEGPAL